VTAAIATGIIIIISLLTRVLRVIVTAADITTTVKAATVVGMMKDPVAALMKDPVAALMKDPVATTPNFLCTD
jgi:hypothetical protein